MQINWQIYISLHCISRNFSDFVLHVHSSVKCSQTDSCIKTWRFSGVSGTDFNPTFRVLLVAWWSQYQNWFFLATSSTLKEGTESIPETSEIPRVFMWLSAQELCHCENFKNLCMHSIWSVSSKSQYWHLARYCRLWQQTVCVMRGIYNTGLVLLCV